jgi:hypothetical protein
MVAHKGAARHPGAPNAKLDQYPAGDIDMQLESIKTYVVGNPPPELSAGATFVFVKIRTACGIEGVGEAYAATFSPHVIAAMAEDLFERVFAGEDPMQTETLWRRAYGEGFSLRPDISLMGVLSALEMACWDITGKALEQPDLQPAGRPGEPAPALLHLPSTRTRTRTSRSTAIRSARPSAPRSMSSRASRRSSSTRSAATRCSTRASRRWSAWTCPSASAS